MALDQSRAKREPIVSVIIPVYNSELSLAEAVESVLNQSLREIEIVIVDDGSTDASLNVAQRLAKSDRRVRVYWHVRNRGQAAARNLAIEKARGRWVAVVDADDVIARDRLQMLSSTGEAQQADLIADGVEFVGPRWPGLPRYLSVGETANGEPQTLSIEALIDSDIPLNGKCSFGYIKPLIRRSFIDRWHLRYEEDLRFAEDFNLLSQALMYGARFVLCPGRSYIYNQTAPLSASRDHRRLPRAASQVIVSNQRMRELARARQIPNLEELLDEHQRRWATVLWFDRLKESIRGLHVADFLRLIVVWPSDWRTLWQFACDRARLKREHSAGIEAMPDSASEIRARRKLKQESP